MCSSNLVRRTSDMVVKIFMATRLNQTKIVFISNFLPRSHQVLNRALCKIWTDLYVVLFSVAVDRDGTVAPHISGPRHE